MNEGIVELMSCCKALDSDKATERKRQIDKFKQLLSKSSVIQSLDKNSDSERSSKSFTWGHVFKIVKSYIGKEIETIRKAKAGSSTAISNRDRRKQEISTLFKWTIRVANKRGERLKSGEIVQHIVEIMEDDFTREAFGADYSNVLLKDVLGVRKYWCELTPKRWNYLLNIYCSAMLKPVSRINRDILARLLYVLVSGATMQCGLQGRRFFTFFNEAVKQLRTEKSSVVLNNIIAAMNIFCRSVAVNARRQLCKLGEDIFTTLLVLWAGRPSLSLKDEIAEFLRLQMSVHHPQGVIEESCGAYANDFDVWKSHLRKLYEAIYNDLRQREGRTKFSSSARETAMKSSYVDLAADVFHQILAERNSEIDVTQMTFSSSTQTPHGNRAKKRRIESGWEMIRDAVTQLAQTKEAIPWLQVTSALLKKHPQGLPAEEIQPFLSVLHQLLTQTKRSDVTSWLLECLQSLAVCQSYQQHNHFTTEVCAALWNKTWTATLRTISLHHTEAKGFDLIRTLIEKNLVTADKEIWRLLAQGKCQLSQSAVHCLATLLKHCPLPENLQPTAAVGMATVPSDRCPLRHHLLKWLLPVDDDAEIAEKTVKVVNRPDINLLAEMLAILTQRHTNATSWKAAPEQNSSRDLELVYLKSTFDFDSTLFSESKPQSETGTTNTSMKTVLKSLIKTMEAIGNQYLENQSSEAAQLQDIIHHCAVVVRVIALLLGYQAVGKEEVKDSRLFEQLRVLFKRTSDTVRDLRARRETELTDKTQSLSVITKTLTELYTWDFTSNLDLNNASKMKDAVDWMASNCRRFTQPDLMDGILETAKTKSFSRSVSMATAADIDDNFMDVDLHESRAVDDFDFDVPEETTESADAIDTTQNTACMSLLNVDHLTEQQSLCVDSIKLLCAWCTGGFTNKYSSGQINPDAIKEHLLGLLDEKVFDPYKPLDLQRLLAVSTGLLSANSHGTDSELEAVVMTLKQVASVHRKDQEICSNILKILGIVIPRLHCAGGKISDELQNAREFVVHLVSVFWQLQKDGQYSTPVRRDLAKCIQAFVQVDPRGTWAVMKQAARGRGDEEGADTTALAEFFPDILKDKNHGIRMLVAEAIPCLFVQCGDHGSMPVSTDLQDKAFAQVLERVQEAASVPDRLQAEEHADEWNNRAASLLKTLSTIACISPVCEKPCIFALIQCIKENNIDLTLMKKVLRETSSHLKYPTIQSLLESHLGYIVSSWLEVGYSLSELPYKLLDCETRVMFYRQYYKVLIPYLVMNNKMDKVESLGRELNQEWVELIKECFPQIIVHIIPTFSHRREGDTVTEELKRRKTHATQILNKIQQILTQQVMERLIQSSLDEIVVELLMTLHEPYSENSDIGQFVKDTDPKPNPPYFTSYTIKATLDYLTGCHQGSKSLVALLSKSQDSIQKILLHLHTHMAKARHIYEKRRSLLMYRLFVILLMQELHEGLGSAWAFVLKDVIYTLVHFLVDVNDSNDLISPSIDLVHAVCDSAMRCGCQEEFGKHLHVIITALVPHADKDTEVGRQAISLIDFLLVEHGTQLDQAIEQLDPLPSSEVFTEARNIQASIKYKGKDFDLIEEIHHFLRVGETSETANCNRLEGLRCLRTYLAEKKDELAVLVTQCEGNPADSILIQLICKLIHLIQLSYQGNGSHGNQKAIQEEAGRCLGEIGAVELSTIALRTTDKKTSYTLAVDVYSEDPQMKRNSVIIHLLKDYLVDPSVDIVSASASCLGNIFATPSGMAFYEDYNSKKIDSLLFYLHPFKPHRKRVLNLPTVAISDEDIAESIGDPTLWVPDHGIHGDWICNLATTLIERGGIRDEFLRLLRPICKVKVEFSEQVLPYLVHEMLRSDSDTCKQVLSQKIQGFFAKHCGNLEDSSRATTPLPMAVDASTNNKISKQSIRTMLEVIHYLRQQNKPRKTGRTSKQSINTVWENNFWLDVDYLQVAKAAQSCAAHFTCILYTEIWCDIQKSKSTPSDSEEDLSQSSQTSMEVLSTLSSNSAINVQSLLLEAYSSIGEPDGIYGCGAGRLTDTSARIHTYEHEHAWDKALTAYDLEIQTPLMSTQVSLLQALQNFGISHVLQTYLQGLNKQLTEQSPELSEFQYQAAWRNCQWDIDDQDRSLVSATRLGYNQSLYNSLCALKDKEPITLAECVSQAQQEVLRRLNTASMESMRNVYTAQSQLHTLVELEDFASVMLGDNRNYDTIQAKWNAQTAILSENDYEFIEPVLTLRNVLLQLLLDRNRNNPRLVQSGLDWQMNHLEYTAKVARKDKRHQAAERAIFSLKQLDREGTYSQASWSWRIEEAKMYWARGEQDTAKHAMKTVTDKLAKVYTRNRSVTQLYAQALGIHGNWSAETHSDSPNIIMSACLEKAVALYESVEDTGREAMEAYLSLARFADAQYQTIVNHMKSPEFEAKQSLFKKTSEELTKLENMKEATQGKNKYTLTLKKQQQIDKQDMENLNTDKANFLETAIENYLRCLEIGDFHDMRVFRLVSLWFENAGDGNINSKLQHGLPKIQSRKFLPLMYQLAARMTTKSQQDEGFQTTLNQLIERTTLDHPHHTLSVILALSNANKDTLITAPKMQRKSSKLAKAKNASNITNEDRMQAAKNMLGRLMNKRGVIISAMETLSDAYIQLAYFNVDQYKKQTRPINLPSELQLPKVKDLRSVAVPTSEIPVSVDCRYDNVVYIKGFESTFRLAGGINLPKIVTCIASDGTRKKQLVKGRDDLRQDAVMQQVFGLVNKLLQKDPETRKRKLTIRRYKVIPLSQRSGILEWCEGTMPLGEYLIGNPRTNQGAHQRYYPRNLSPWECRIKMNATHGRGQEEKHKTFKYVCERFPPVFRHFFLENFHDPAVWFERRLAYTRSVATSSIVGYVVGLGDRHVQNILIDCNTAELVHIDLGVAFEQGRILPTPETVPFRLSRDLVDGMGIAEVEGVFRRCCEKTMVVMHNNQEALLTIIEVLLYDPLYVWTLSPLKAIQLQQNKADPDVSELNITNVSEREMFEGSDSSEGNSAESNKMAERVLLRLQQKLKGVEEGVVVSVSGQVNRLIQEARDPKNLCKLFPGWQAWI